MNIQIKTEYAMAEQEIGVVRVIVVTMETPDSIFATLFFLN